jgi:hypothetical protein
MDFSELLKNLADRAAKRVELNHPTFVNKKGDVYQNKGEWNPLSYCGKISLSFQEGFNVEFMGVYDPEMGGVVLQIN